ncbi:VPLPA-CTERM sorting domain-containing protein [Cereibacter sp. SYSU M97828]|nr:VPLPA-CTERM sorting domain-containing protein [Cereibacter flavus]
MFEGFRGDTSVAFAAIAMGVEGSNFTFNFGESFRGIDRLIISTPYEADEFPDNDLACFDCSAIVYDNLTYTLAPVPLPATGLLLMTGLAGALLLTRRRRI